MARRAGPGTSSGEGGAPASLVSRTLASLAAAGVFPVLLVASAAGWAAALVLVGILGTVALVVVVASRTAPRAVFPILGIAALVATGLWLLWAW